MDKVTARKHLGLHWYEAMDEKTHERFWWTQRDENGVCFEIRKKSDVFCLYKCEKFTSKHGSLQETMDEAELSNSRVFHFSALHISNHSNRGQFQAF